MGKRVFLRRKARRGVVGDMTHRITIQDRAITPPDDGDVDLDHTFTTAATVWASVETLSGETLFDGVEKDDIVSHSITIRYIEGVVSSESWILLPDGTRLDILNVEDLEERHEWLHLLAKRTGADTLPAAQA